jgi:hypothetical protein
MLTYLCDPGPVAVLFSLFPTITRLPGTTTHSMTDTYVSLDVQIELIETEIARLRAQARELRVRRNALAPFARLPAEVVHYILDIVMQKTLLEQDPYATWSRSNPEVWYAPQERIGWIDILGVCTFLRDLAIAYPALWSYIDLTRKYLWVDTCAERARDHPLRITYSGPADDSKDGLLRYLMERACDARISTMPSGGLSFVSSVVNGAHPHLRSLTYAPKEGPWLGLDTSFLGTARSTITRLVLVNVRLVPDEIPLPALEYLECKRIHVADQSGWIFNLIRGAPRLGYLRLREIEGAINIDVLHVPPIDLPHLVCAQLSADLDWISAFLLSMSAPRRIYTIAVPQRSPNMAAPRSTALRSMITENIFRLPALNKHTHSQSQVCLSTTEDLGSWKIEITLSGGQFDLHYLDYSTSCETLHPILHRAESLRVNGVAVYIFAHAVGCVVDPLAAVDELVLESMDSLGELRAWLRRRAEAQRVVRSLEFRRCQGIFGNRAAFKRYAYTILDMELVIAAWTEDVYGDDDQDEEMDAETDEEA